MNQPNPAQRKRYARGFPGPGMTILLVVALLLSSASLAFGAPAQTSLQAPATVLQVAGPATNPKIGETFDVQVKVADVADLGAYQVKLTYNPALVKAVSVAGQTSFLTAPAIALGPTFTSGAVEFGALSLGAGVSGSGVLATVKFEALAAGTSPLALAASPATKLSTPAGGDIPYTATSGSVVVVSADTSVRVLPVANPVQVGSTFSVDVVADFLLNSGSFEFQVNYNPLYLKVLSVTGASFLPPTVTELKDTATPGVIRYGQFSTAAAGPSVNNQKLATIEFMGIAAGSSALDLNKVILTTAAGAVQGKITAVDATATVSPLPVAKFSVQPATQTAMPGDDVYVDVKIEAAVNLGAFEFDLAYDPALLAYLGASSPTTGFLASTGRTALPVETTGPGTLGYGQYSIGSAAGPSGDGTLVRLHFRALAVGTSPLTLSGTVASTVTGYAQPTSATSGQVVINPLPTGNVYVAPASKTVEIGDFFTVDILANPVEDLGGFQFDLAFDDGLLDFVELTGGTALSDAGRVVTPIGPTVGVGQLSYGQISTDGNKPGPDGGPVKLATVKFRAVAVGSSALDLSKTILTTTKGFEQPSTATDGQVTVTPLPTATVRLVVTDKACVRGEFDVEVWVDKASNLGSYQFKLGFNSVLVEAVGAVDGGFLASTGRTVIPVAPTITANSIAFGAASINGGKAGPNGTGRLAVVTFRAKTLAGATDLLLSDVILTDVDSFVQPNTTVNGSATVKPFVIKIVPATTQVLMNEPLFTVNVEAECAYNLGAFEFGLDFDAALVKALDVMDGGFLASTGRMVLEVGENIDNAAGFLEYGQISTDNQPGPNGDGVLAQIKFEARKAGCGSPLDLINVNAADTTGAEQVPVVYSGSVCVGERVPLGAIGGMVWRDAAGDGVKDAYDPGVAGVKVTLSCPGQHGGPLTATATTGANGRYNFTELWPDTCTVDLDTSTLPPYTFLTVGTDPRTVTIALSEEKQDVDFGVTANGVFGWVFIDANENGWRDGGETAGIGGVPINLVNAATNAVVASRTSSTGTGWFSFEGIPAGNYRVVQVTQPAGYTSTSPDTVVVAVTNGTAKNVNFGEAAPVQPTATPTATNTPCVVCEPTQTPAPTWTPVPTYTPAPTYTPYPTYTPVPTATPTATRQMFHIYLPILVK